MTDKLADTFNIDNEGFENGLITVEIPDDADLDDITKLALQAYKEQMETIKLMEPKYRSRALEVAHSYLALAKDSLSKKEELNQKERKLLKELGGESEKVEKEVTYSRTQIIADIAEARKKKKTG